MTCSRRQGVGGRTGTCQIAASVRISGMFRALFPPRAIKRAGAGSKIAGAGEAVRHRSALKDAAQVYPAVKPVRPIAEAAEGGSEVGGALADRYDPARPWREAPAIGLQEQRGVRSGGTAGLRLQNRDVHPQATADYRHQGTIGTGLGVLAEVQARARRAVGPALQAVPASHGKSSEPVEECTVRAAKAGPVEYHCRQVVRHVARCADQVGGITPGRRRRAAHPHPAEAPPRHPAPQDRAGAVSRKVTGHPWKGVPPMPEFFRDVVLTGNEHALSRAHATYRGYIRAQELPGDPAKELTAARSATGRDRPFRAFRRRHRDTTGNAHRHRA